MNKNVIIIIVAIVALCCCGGGAAVFFISKKAVDAVGVITKEAEPFAEKSIKDISENWDPTVFRKVAVTDISDAAIQDFCQKLQPLGKCSSVTLTQSGIDAKNNNGDTLVTISYTGSGQFENGTAKIECTVVKHNETWQVKVLDIKQN